MKKRLLAIVLTMAMVLSGMMMPAKAEAKESKLHATGLVHIVSDEGMTVEEKAAKYGAVAFEGKDQAFPAKFDLRDYGLATSPKNQGEYGMCWAFAAIGSMESNALVMGYGEYDFSEYEMGYFSKNLVEGQDEMIEGEGFDTGKEWYEGGFPYWVEGAFMKGYGPALEEKYPYKNIKKKLTIEATKDALFRGDACYFVSSRDTNAIKELLTRNGAMDIHVCAGSWSNEKGTGYGGKYCNPENWSMYVPADVYAEEYQHTDHAVTLVGWDDNYSKENFATQPEGDGAWIVKNSWGEDWGNSGYFYLSYYDGAINDTETWESFTLSPLNTCDYQYQYDGAYGGYYIADATDVAIAFEVKADQTMTGVQVKPLEEDDGTFAPVNAEIKVYKNVKSIDKLGEAKLLYTQKAVIAHPQYQTIEFNKGLNINAGDKLYVVVTFDRAIKYACDGPSEYEVQDSTGKKTKVRIVASAKEGETFMKVERDGKWYDHVADADEDPANSVCIKVMVRNGHDMEVIHRDPNAVNLEEPTFYLLNNEEAKVTVTWKEVENAEGYNIYRKVKGVENEFTLLAKVEAGTTKYADKNLTIGQDYIYKVVPFAGSVEGTSAEKTIRATIAAPWLTKLANNKKGQVTVSIKAVKGAKSYSVYRLIGKTYQYLGNTTKTTYVDAFKKGKYEKGVTYTYKLAVKVGDRTSALSAAKSITVTK